MIKKYYAVESDKAKYCKKVPYISKKEFNKLEDTIIVGSTKLKKYKTISENKEFDLLSYEKKEYEVKEKIIGIKKGYIYIGENNYIELKRCIPFLFILFVLILLLLFCYFKPNNKVDNQPIEKPIKEEIIIPEKIEDDNNFNITEEITKTEIPKNDKNNKYPQVSSQESSTLEFLFDSNSGYGNMESISCNIGEKCTLSKNEFLKEGYSFGGWSIEKSGTLMYEDQSEIDTQKYESSEAITLYAIWNINSYKITFLDFDDTIISEEELDYGQEIITPVNPTRYGYTFIGWDNDNDIVKENMEIKALYDLNTYKLSYSLNGGEIKEAPPSYNVESETFSIPKPTKTGYTFLGWTTQENDVPNKNYTIEKGSTEDIELMANYKANIYNLIFNSNDDNDSIIIRKVEFNSEYDQLPEVSKEGYVFNCWKNADGESVSNKTIFDIPEDINIYAEWEIVEYDIIYDLNGGEIKEAPPSYNVESETFLIPEPTKTGYTFIGWTTQENDVPNKNYTVEKGTTGDIELIANYEPISYYINYDSSNGIGNMKQDKFVYNQSKKLSENIYTKEGYNFLGWSSSYDGVVVYNDEDEIYNLTTTNNEIITLYAKWEIIKLNVKYYDLFGALLKEETVDYGNKSQAPENPTLDGYTFEKWSLDSTIIKTDTIYKAQYSKNQYSIEYDLNMGKESDKTKFNYNVESEPINLPTPTRIGYTFLGWTGSNGIRPQISVSINKGTVGDKKYKANWISNVYNITLNANGGTVDISSILVSYNSLYGELPTPSRRGYTFEGWYYGENLVTNSTLQNKEFDHELKAKWRVINYDITYNLSGGSASPLQTSYNVESNTFTLPTPTRTGYTFLGWIGTELSSATKTVSINKGSLGNRNYTATWQINYYTVNYYQNGSLWASRSVQYGASIPNLTPSGYDNYHKFGGWSGWSDTMPPNDINLTAITSESYCMLRTGTASKANAEGLKAIFDDVGYRSWLFQSDLGWGAETDYSLSRRQVDGLREIFANRVPWANATPYLNWLFINCDNGHGEVWKRYSNGNTWTILESW